MQPVRNQVRQLWEKSKAALSRPMPLGDAVAEAGVWLARDDVAMGTAIRVELWCEDPTRGNAAIDEVMAGNPQQLADYRSGKDKLFGFFVGQVMKATQGKANPAQLNELLKQKLAG